VSPFLTHGVVSEHIEYSLLLFIYKVLTTTEPSCLHNVISVQSLDSSHYIVTALIPKDDDLSRCKSHK